MRGMSQLRPTFTQLPLSVILSGVRSRRLSAVYPTIDSPFLTPEERKTQVRVSGMYPVRVTRRKRGRTYFYQNFKYGTIESKILWRERIIEKNLSSWNNNKSLICRKNTRTRLEFTFLKQQKRFLKLTLLHKFSDKMFFNVIAFLVSNFKVRKSTVFFIRVEQTKERIKRGWIYSNSLHKSSH